ncbi:dTDP-glucose 4,6-dehydratase [Halorubrum sp. Ea8]|uniref:dTDP-glucose 4,6-dehydratase n=1 Tax=Halorubrum sp. Ea8 TaxID=1383841 RepID=UPI000B992C73|nr:dTDP-glucose 4,6-dehydratase [Halorubrum sp. Ea8]OYR44581.1 dTDP-glucose 4,6-dehydratase [Halorubrum sp. Ea8]
MEILVTGGAGFIGSNFVHYMLKTYDDVQLTTLDALTYAGSRDNLEGTLDTARHRFVEGDVCNRELVADLVDGVDAVVNFAAESHVDRSINDSKPFVKTNVEGTQVLLDAAVGADLDRFLQVSTDEVYGEILDGSFGETDPLNPRNPYAATKAGADLLVQSYQETHDLPTVITRTCNNFGPRQHQEKLIPKLIRNAVRGDRLPIYGDGSNVREWIYVEDNCRALDTVLRSGEIGEVYNIGTGEEMTNLNVAKTIVDVVDASRDQITLVEDRPGHDQRYALDTSKLESMGWEPTWSFEEGIRETIEYYRPV